VDYAFIEGAQPSSIPTGRVDEFQERVLADTRVGKDEGGDSAGGLGKRTREVIDRGAGIDVLPLWRVEITI